MSRGGIGRSNPRFATEEVKARGSRWRAQAVSRIWMHAYDETPSAPQAECLGSIFPSQRHSLFVMIRVLASSFVSPSGLRQARVWGLRE